MVSSIRPSSVGAVSSVGRGGGGKSTRTGSALRGLAGRIAERMAREFDLLDEREERSGDRDQFREGEDIYEIRAVARELAGDLRARPTDEGRIARSLDLFAQESASLLAARPGAASLDTIARVIAVNDAPTTPETLERAVGQIDETARGIADSKA